MGQPLRTTVNQAFTATPDDAAVNTVSAASPNENRGSRQYTVNVGDATQVDIQLFEAAFVTTDDDGNVSFRDTDSNNVADAGAPAGSIAVVNGAGTSGTRVNNVTPINGQVTFTINSTTAGSVIPVVYADTDGDNALDLVVASPTNANPKQPSEDFGVGGQKTWVPEEAATGALAADEDVTSVNKDQDFIVANGKTYNYDANDVFQIATANAAAGADEASTCTNTTLSNFEAQLSTGDQLDRSTNYTREEAASSTFCLEDVSPGAPQTVTATAQDSDTIRVAWTAPTTGAPDNYRVYRLQTAAACPTTLASYTLVTTVSGTTLQYDDNGLAANTRYCYVVTAVQNGDESAIGGPANATTSEAGTTVQPQSTDAYVATDTNFPGVVSATDEWRIVFDKVMQTPDVTDTIVVQDAQGDRLDVICDGVIATCRLNTAAVTVDGTSYPAGRVLTVVIEGAGIIAADSTPSGSMNDQLEYPVTVVTQNGIVDLAGNAWTPADDPDRVIDQEAGKAETGTFAADATAPTLASTTGSGTALTTTWNEAVDGIDATDFVVYSDAACTTVVATGTAFTSDNGDPTLVTTLDAAPAGANFVRVAAGGVQDLQDNANAQTACTAVTFS